MTPEEDLAATEAMVEAYMVAAFLGMFASTRMSNPVLAFIIFFAGVAFWIGGRLGYELCVKMRRELG